MKEKLRNFIDDSQHREGKIFHLFLQILIVLSLFTFALETVPNLNPEIKYALHCFEIACLVIFSIEYVLRIYSAKHPLKYVFSFLGLVDLISILPFYLGNTVDLRSLRIFRIFRIFRILKMVRYTKALNRFRVATRIVREEIVLFLILTLIFVFISSTGIYYFENEAQPEIFKSILHSFWWAIVTLTTVGYGDTYPITVGGKIFTSFVLLAGVGIVTIPAGLVASALSKARELENDK
jgi:voltage-gated potassium channel